MGFVSKLLSFGSDKDLKRYWKTVDAINALEPAYEGMGDEELRDQTRVFRDRLAAGETLDALLPEAFAVVREASSAPSVFATSMCSSSAAWLCTRGRSPR